MKLANVNFALFLAIFVSGCGPQQEGGAVAEEQLSLSRASAPAQEEAFEEANQGEDPTAFGIERKLIRTGYLQIEVESVKEAIEEVRQLSELFSGFLVDTEITREDEGHYRARLSIQVPSGQFDEAVAACRQLGNARHEKIDTRDITKAYTDLTIRLQVKRQTEERLRELLRTRTGNLSDVLAVERELGRVIGEIEQMEGERRYYDQQITMSTITLELYEPRSGIGLGVFSKIGEAFRNSLEVLATSMAAIVYFVSFVVPWLLLTGVVWWVVRSIRKRRRET